MCKTMQADESGMVAALANQPLQHRMGRGGVTIDMCQERRPNTQ
jgi:hypothetical protein